MFEPVDPTRVTFQLVLYFGVIAIIISLIIMLVVKWVKRK